MTRRLYAVYDGKVLQPENSIDLKPNVRYLVTIEEETTPWDILNTLSGTIEGPKDWSEEHDHYLYSIPKHKKIR